MRCSVNKNRRQSVKDIVFLLLILGIIKGKKDCLVTIFIIKNLVKLMRWRGNVAAFVVNINT